MQLMKKTKTFLLGTFTMLSLVLPSSMALATESTVMPETEIREVETPDFVQEAIYELEQDNSGDRVVYFPETYADISDSVNIAAYRDWHFGGRSAPEPLVLRKSCDTISLTATCTDPNMKDTLVFHIMDITHDGLYDTDLVFTADSSVTTIARRLPEGQYKVFFTGDTAIEKYEAIAVFSRFE